LANGLISGKRISVVGLGRRSGIPVAEVLHDMGATVFGSDSSPREVLEGDLRGLEMRGIEAEFGGHTGRVLDADFIVKSPGVPMDIPILERAKEVGVPVYDEVEVAFWLCRAPIVAVTGSNGKTTTVSLIAGMLERSGLRALPAGNIGYPLSRAAVEATCDDIVVAEISSFQLEGTERFRPHIAVLLNITPDHLDRHGSFERYVDIKSRIFLNQGPEDFAVVNYDDPPSLRAARGIRSRLCPFSAGGEPSPGAFVRSGEIILSVGGSEVGICRADELKLRGPHNLMNSLAAAIASYLAGADPGPIADFLRSFRGIEHRLEFVRELEGVAYFNDSKATNVDAAKRALESFDRPIVLIAGGRDKMGDFGSLRDLVRSRVKAVILMGEAADKIESSWRGLTDIRRSGSMEEAVRTARGIAVEGDVVLLAPACASFDMFRDYEHRGEAFKEAVRSLG